ncbi:MAG: hypothetical protein IPM34_07455 [Saprospiraceae bacterium]|nr:hypothetical protein [Saprospiraceae bacterium]
MVHYRILTLLLSFHVLVAQIGLSVFMLYCCCSKNIEYSFIPKEDRCVKTHPAKSCHLKDNKCKKEHGKAAPCENQIVEYKSLDFDAEKPSQKKSADFTTPSHIPQLNILPLAIASGSQTNPIPDKPYFLSGKAVLINYVIWRC